MAKLRQATLSKPSTLRSGMTVRSETFLRRRLSTKQVGTCMSLTVKARTHVRLRTRPQLRLLCPRYCFRNDPACAGGRKAVFAAGKDVEPIRFKRQFPVSQDIYSKRLSRGPHSLIAHAIYPQRYVGGVLFESFLEVIANCDRWHWDLFTVSEQYLPKLLTGEYVMTWAAR